MVRFKTVLFFFLFLSAAASFAAPAENLPPGMVLVEGGSFLMGSPDSEAGRFDWEGPQHQVTLGSFYLGRYEVTQQEWLEVMDGNPSGFKGDTLPVETVSWYDAIEYCNKLSLKEGLTPAYMIDKEGGDPKLYDGGDDVRWAVTWNRGADGYRLPTEAEWEYACRAGTTTRYYNGDREGALVQIGNVADITGQEKYPEWSNYRMWSIVDGRDGYAETAPAGMFSPNTWGLYDMSGNVYEWCWDRFRNYDGGAQTDPEGSVYFWDKSRVMRGGSWRDPAAWARSGGRGGATPSYRYNNCGFRLARSRFIRATEFYYPPGMVRVEGGTFLMGSPASEEGRVVGRFDIEAQHRVTVSGFYMGRYEVTQKEWTEVMGSNPSRFKGDNFPVEMVTWYDAVEYCNRRSVREGLTPAYTIDKGRDDPNNRSENDTVKWLVTWNRSAGGYRLPTEAEWEYACRAGTATRYYNGDREETLIQIGNIADATWETKNPGWTRGEGRDGYPETAPVGMFLPNAWGLYDMIGNVWEWCWDWYGNYGGTQTDPAGPSSGSGRVRRGGSWYGYAPNLRSAYRGVDPPYSRADHRGFRLVRSRIAP